MSARIFVVQVWKRVGKRAPKHLPETRVLVKQGEVECEETEVAASTFATALNLPPDAWRGGPRPTYVIRVWPLEKAPTDVLKGLR